MKNILTIYAIFAPVLLVLNASTNYLFNIIGIIYMIILYLYFNTNKGKNFIKKTVKKADVEFINILKRF